MRNMESNILLYTYGIKFERLAEDILEEIKYKKKKQGSVLENMFLFMFLYFWFFNLNIKL